ncbi:MAG TPA: response regulator [Terriglobales bacterium]|jgi:DNA-binding NtrC family response regulator|nr:response regulator [Terriglobales bacterium]
MAKAKKPEVLVVEDEASVLLTYRLLLEEEGYKVVAALSSQKAEEILAKKRFDLVLCDFTLEQNHTGFEVFERVRKRDAKVPCVMLTGYANRETTERAEQAGIRVFFKPIEIEDFLQTLKTILRNSHG